MFSVAGAPMVHSCSLLQLSMMLKMPWLGMLPIGERSLGSMHPGLHAMPRYLVLQTAATRVLQPKKRQ